MNKIGIALKKGLVIVGADTEFDNRRLVSLVNHQLMQLGYMLSEEAFIAMSKTDTLDIVIFSKTAINFYQNYLGTGNHKTLSDLVLDGDLFDTHWSLLSRFWHAQEWEPVHKENYDFEPSKLKILNFADEKKFLNIFTTLVRVNTALTSKDFKTIEWFMREYGKDNLPMPKDIPFKENLCMIAAYGVDVPVKTPTDVLRIAAYMSGLGTDLILPSKKIKKSGWSQEMIDNPEYKTHKFRTFKRPERRYLLSLLDKVAFVSDMKAHEGRWLRLLHMLSPQDYTKQYPKAAAAAYSIRNQSTKKQLKKSLTKNSYIRNPKVKTWKGKLAAAYDRSFEEGLKVQQEKPGEFARALDALMRNNDMHAVLRAFKQCAHKVSNKVLFELYTHFQKRTEKYTRKIFIKGARTPVELKQLEPMNKDLVEEIIDTIWEILFEKFKLLDSLGKVWIDEKLKKIPLPTNMRTLGDSLTVVIRGTRVPIDPEIKLINAYIYWTAGFDLDVSMTFINVNNKHSKICSYMNLHPIPSVRHSGDIIPSIDGKYAEYIGVDIEKTLEIGYRYGLMTVHNFLGGALDDVGAITGFQSVNKILSSKTWLPSNAEAATKLGSKASTTALILFDFQEKEWILVDIDLNQIPASHGPEFTKYIEDLSIPPKVSVYTLLRMHADARGALVEKIEDAETVFNFEDFSTSYEKTIEYML